MINITDSLEKHSDKRYATRSLDQIQMIVVHHFAGNISIENAAKMHVEKNGWPGIGYHIVIDKDGTIYVTNEIRTNSYHCGGHNTRSIGIALQGNWRKKLPTWDQLDSLEYIIDIVRWAVGRDISVYPHSAFRPTDCPGDPLREWLEENYPAPLSLKYEVLNPDDEMFDDDYER